MEEKKEEKKELQGQVNAIGSPDKAIPKFCSQINFGITNNGLVIMSMLYIEPNNQPALIERVMIDLPHAKQVVQVLSDLLNKADKAKTP